MLIIGSMYRQFRIHNVVQNFKFLVLCAIRWWLLVQGESFLRRPVLGEDRGATASVYSVSATAAMH